MFFKEVYKPRISDYDRSGKLSYEAILQILENAASNHSASAGDSVSDANKSGIAWILTEWRVKILHRPENGEILNITTWVRGKTPASIVYRDFILKDKDGVDVIRAEAKFALLDLITSRLTRINEELFAAYGPEERTVFDNISRLRAPSGYTAECELALRCSDIDFNGHVHNTKYVDFALQALPQNILYADTITEIQVVYTKPVKDSDNVRLKYLETEAGHIVSVTVDGLPYAIIKIKGKGQENVNINKIKKV